MRLLRDIIEGKLLTPYIRKWDENKRPRKARKRILVPGNKRKFQASILQFKKPKKEISEKETQYNEPDVASKAGFRAPTTHSRFVKDRKSKIAIKNPGIGRAAAQQRREKGSHIYLAAASPLPDTNFKLKKVIGLTPEQRKYISPISRRTRRVVQNAIAQRGGAVAGSFSHPTHTRENPPQPLRKFTGKTATTTRFFGRAHGIPEILKRYMGAINYEMIPRPKFKGKMHDAKKAIKKTIDKIKSLMKG